MISNVLYIRPVHIDRTLTYIVQLLLGATLLTSIVVHHPADLSDALLLGVVYAILHQPLYNEQKNLYVH